MYLFSGILFNFHNPYVLHKNINLFVKHNQNCILQHLPRNTNELAKTTSKHLTKYDPQLKKSTVPLCFLMILGIV